ncbi:hypothetical protein [uncultured Roseivirga sp.]|uniref:hypothetical protein n=1 Tax=uncultured Roseivirga sp. TaxID=543088 RepID=UPI0030DB646C
MQPVEPRVINDSIALTVQITTVEELNKKAGLVELDFYYLPSSFEKSNFDLPVTNSQKVTSIQLENDVSSQTEVNLKFKWLEGHSLYVQQLITKKKRKTHSPLLIIMESIENNTPQQ